MRGVIWEVGTEGKEKVHRRSRKIREIVPKNNWIASNLIVKLVSNDERISKIIYICLNKINRLIKNWSSWLRRKEK